MLRSPTDGRRRYRVVFPVREGFEVGQNPGGFRGTMASSVNSNNLPSTSVSKTKTKKKHFVSQNVSVFRAGNPVVSVFMWGVNHSINELNHVPAPVMLLPDDFRANSKIKVNNHLFNKENLPSNFKFKEYCPQVFRNLRDRFGIDDTDYQVGAGACYFPHSGSQTDIWCHHTTLSTPPSRRYLVPFLRYTCLASPLPVLIAWTIWNFLG
ncbi:phosphatidylinositol 5-phosphate 4-kinase type-2 gamma-like [Mobula birostris]|uniref:phosphatidylinositol 5-phosphate 4-kinase type-2 gamma-like n=1 Tax=Mobula birostris TaxID=1983395 RepID=UPI003B285B4A